MVKVISVTQGMGELAGKSAEEVIVYAARVSNPNNQMNFATSAKLLKYLVAHKHWSPLEMASMCVEIKTSRAIAAQILRHKSMQFQEFSQRYQVVNNTIKYEARRQDLKNKQNSIDNMSEEDKQWFLDAQNQVSELSNKLYNEALSKGVAKEQARFLLPLNTETTLYMSGTIRSFVHYIQVRSDESTQKEHRDIAIEIKNHLKVHFPNVAEALEW